MKNEAQIVELLAETLKKQDRQEALLGKLVEITSKHSEILSKVAEGQDRLIYEFHKMNDHLLTRQEKIEDRVSRLEDRVFKS